MSICKICKKDVDDSGFYTGNKSTCKECVKIAVYNQRLIRETKKAEMEGRVYRPQGHHRKSEDPDKKWCTECNKLLSLTSFGFTYKKNSDGIKSRRVPNSCCKKCAVIRTQRVPNRESNIKKSNETKAILIDIDPEYKNHIREQKLKYSRSNLGLITSLYAGAKKRSYMYNLEFTIDKSDIIIPVECPILHIPLSVGKVGGSDYSPSLDRIDSTKGYIKGNVQVISHLANAMKNSASSEQIQTFINNIRDYMAPK